MVDGNHTNADQAQLQRLLFISYKRTWLNRLTGVCDYGVRTRAPLVAYGFWRGHTVIFGAVFHGVAHACSARPSQTLVYFSRSLIVCDCITKPKHFSFSRHNKLEHGC
jgi:hypothetical protein